MTRYKPPMTADEAREIVAEMKARTKSKEARHQLWRHGVQFGNLSDEAKDVYREALESEGASE